MNRPNSRILGAVFDCDGTLLDTEPLYVESYAKTAEILSNGRVKKEDYTFDHVHQYLLGRAEVEGAKNFIRILQLDGFTPHQVLEKRDEIMESSMRNVKPLPGALNVLQEFRARNIPIAIATSGCRRHTEELKMPNNKELFDFFNSTLVCGDDASVKGKTKPDPAIFLEAAKLIDVDPVNCIAFEDSIAGIKSAKAAGMFVVAVPDSRLRAEEVEEAKPDIILQSLEYFDASSILS